MSKAHLPPVPPDNVGPHGDTDPGKGPLNPREAKRNMKDRTTDPTQQGQQRNTHQNTHHQGYQQDR